MSPRKRNAERDDDASAASQRPLTPEIVDADEDTIDAFGEDAAETLDDDPDDAEGASPDSGVDPSRAAVLVPNDAPLLPSTETDRGGDALSRYMAQLAHHAPISREEEHALAVRWKEDGDVDAARQLVMHNLRLVVKIAFEYRRAWTQTLDLIQEGNVGLMEAVQRYDPYKGVKLSTYAVYWIRAYILKYILDNMRSVRLGTTRAQRKLFFRLNKEKRELERQGYEVEPALIAERLDVSEQDVIEMEASLSRPDTYLDAPMRDEDGSASFGDFLPAEGTSAEEALGGGELAAVFRQQIDEFRALLDERELRILDERVLAEDPKTLAEMGELFGVSRERVRQLEARLVDKLRAYVKSELVDFEYYAPEADE